MPGGVRIRAYQGQLVKEWVLVMVEDTRVDFDLFCMPKEGKLWR